jgi:hypothetical protein
MMLVPELWKISVGPIVRQSACADQYRRFLRLRSDHPLQHKTLKAAKRDHRPAGKRDCRFTRIEGEVVRKD